MAIREIDDATSIVTPREHRDEGPAVALKLRIE